MREDSIGRVEDYNTKEGIEVEIFSKNEAQRGVTGSETTERDQIHSKVLSLHARSASTKICPESILLIRTGTGLC